MRKLYHFHGGIHPPSNKTQSTRTAIAHAPLPAKLIVPLHQHVGETAKPVVQAGDHVLKGQLIGMPDGFVSSAVHAPTSGTITAIDMQLIAHPSGLPNLCVTLIPDGKDEWIARKPVDYREHSPAELQHLLRMAGVVGLGGAAFPSDVKLRIGTGKIGTLILNGAECEPYITCDDMLMRERAAEIVQGAELLRHMLDADEVLFGVEDNKPEAIAALQQAIRDSGLNHETIAIPTIYPGGGAKQLIRVLTGSKCPPESCPPTSACNASTSPPPIRVHRALALGEPLLSRIVTVTGNVRHAQNFEVLIGTPIAELVALAGALPDTDGYIMGGPMMGFSLPDVHVPLVKATNCIIAASDKLFPPPAPAMPCIRCTRCVEVCPADLQPQDLLLVCAVQGIRQGAGIQPVRLHRMRCMQLCLPQPHPAGAVLPFCQERDSRARARQATRGPGKGTPRVSRAAHRTGEAGKSGEAGGQGKSRASRKACKQPAIDTAATGGTGRTGSAPRAYPRAGQIGSRTRQGIIAKE